ncbi:glutathione S-transferase N-terminal domain-containing protein [Thiotrichales bacterium 19S11-10]|nr:glutathione S-transferase N-terminal domain-containing protein [Thiotrichales bacterium 19S11-10]MCF6807355.1 glutathione S-transferase N-terminal domain-containing protein [Thiotrichales bacterium 19S9-11]MCF6811324.1 glutathione S-transferase N-terminal domain-containing protein [Thiotrichales bacterium 19S9-12]
MSLTLYSYGECVYSHRIRYILAEKKIPYQLIEINPNKNGEQLSLLNPYGKLPVLKERDQTFYDADVIMYYLDERHPMPALMPGYPVLRSKTRLAILRIEKDWYSMMDMIVANGKDAKAAKKALEDSFKAIEPIFASSEFFMSDELSLADCTLVPLLWRLPLLGIKLDKKFGAVKDYADRLFEREAFKKSLSKFEKQLAYELEEE